MREILGNSNLLSFSKLLTYLALMTTINRTVASEIFLENGVVFNLRGRNHTE